MELQDLLLKTAPELNDIERAFIKEHEPELSDEDRDAYKEFLTSPQEPEETPETPEEPETPETPETPEIPGEPEEPETPQFQFKTEEEAKEFVRNLQKEEEAKKQAAIDAVKTPAEKKYVEDNWKPKDWNEGMKKAVELAKEEIRKEEKEKQEQAAVDYWNKEWAKISKEKNIPALTSPEGQKIHKEIIHLMQAKDLKTFKEGYELREKLEGALSGTPVIPVNTDKAKARKEAAAKLGKAQSIEEKSKSSSGVRPFKSYEELHNATSRGILRDLD